MSTKLSILFALVGLMLGSNTFAQKIESAYDVMTFEDSFTCSDKSPHYSFCKAVQFKAWTAQEKAVVGAYLKNIKDPRLAYFLKTIKERGITKIHRVGFASSWYNNSAKRRVEFVRITDKAILWVNPVTHVIGFTDAFFKTTPYMDPYAHVERKQLNVLHELVHVFDIATDHESSAERFQAASGWTWNGKAWVINGVDYDKATAEFQSVLDLAKSKETAAAAYSRDRERGRTYGFPTLYAMTDAHESFAEIISYYIFDPTSDSYYSKELVQYVKSVLRIE